MSRKERIRKLLEQEPDDVFLNFALAMEMAGEGDAAGALQQLDRVIEIDSDYIAAYMQKGQFLIAQGRREEATAALQRGAGAARRQGDAHALSELEGLLATL